MAASLSVFSVPCSAQCSGYAKLNRFERTQFIQVALSQRAEVSAQFLAENGCGEQMTDNLLRLGAKVDYSDEKSGYALVSIPREKLLATLDIRGIAYAFTRDDDGVHDPGVKIPQSERRSEPVPHIQIPYPRVATTLPEDGPYFAADEIGLTELWKLHPQADGRGVRVAVPDEGFDLLHPALREARDGSGEIVPKVADLGTLTTPQDDSGWVEMDRVVKSKGGVLEVAGRNWYAPEDKTYRFGIFSDELTLGPVGSPNVQKLALAVGVLWDEQTNNVWVDTDGDGDFRNQKALTDYANHQQIDWFGSKEGDEDNRIPFGVKIDPMRKALYIRIGGDHGAFVAGPLAANTLTGGLVDGAAPSAQLIDSYSHRDTYVADTVRMFARADVDVINRSGGIGRAGFSGRRDGAEDFAQRVLQRCIEIYDKPIASYSAAPGTIHVNDYAGPEMLRRNRRVPPPYLDSMNSFVWDLPSGLVNTVLAPSANLATESRYDPVDLPLPDGRKASYSDTAFVPPAPDGYVIGSNPSPTIPVVSGVLADLISQAKREHVRYNATRLNNAIFTGSRLLDGFPLSEQGYGLINASQSWNQLARMANADDPTNPALTSLAVSRLTDGKFVEVHGFHADLANPGGDVEGEIWITRHGGFAGERKYSLTLRGNNGSFKLLDHEATLKQGEPVRIRFHVDGRSGWNIVFLELRDVKADVVMQYVPLSVRIPDAPESIGPGVDRFTAEIPPLRRDFKYIRSENEVQAASYMVKIPYTNSEGYLPGGRINQVNSQAGDPVDAVHHVGPIQTYEYLTVNTNPGTQVMWWENRGRPEYSTPYDPPAPDVPIHAELRVTKYAIDIKRSGDSLSLTNELAAIHGRVELYNAKLQTYSLRGTGSHVISELDRTIPANLAEWRLRITPNGASEGTADVYVLNCASKDAHCYTMAAEEINSAVKMVTIDKPQAGAWKVIVRNRDRVRHLETYCVQEAMLTPSAAPIETADAKHASGATWSVTLPAKKGDAQYAAFHIAGTPGKEGTQNDGAKNGVRIALTPLDSNAP